jgi:hypothetical protein
MVNADGLTLFGAGSEWFWSMLQFVVVAITLAGIYVQLRQARAANAFAQTNAMAEQWNDERMVRRRLAVATILRDDGADADLSAHLSAIGNFWENVAALVRAGHVEIGVVRETLGTACRVYWPILEPDVRKLQAMHGSDLFEHFEWLANEIVRHDRAHGIPDTVLTRENAVAILFQGIPVLRAYIADFEAMRTTILAAAQPSDVVVPSAAADAATASG